MKNTLLVLGCIFGGIVAGMILLYLYLKEALPAYQQQAGNAALTSVAFGNGAAPTNDSFTSTTSSSFLQGLVLPGAVLQFQSDQGYVPQIRGASSGGGGGGINVGEVEGIVGAVASLF